MRTKAGNNGPLAAFSQLNVSPTGAITAAADAVTLASYLVPGIEPGDVGLLSPNATVVNTSPMTGYCLVAGTLIVPWVNPTAAPIGPFAGDGDVFVYKASRGQDGPGGMGVTT